VARSDKILAPPELLGHSEPGECDSLNCYTTDAKSGVLVVRMDWLGVFASKFAAANRANS